MKGRYDKTPVPTGLTKKLEKLFREEFKEVSDPTDPLEQMEASAGSGSTDPLKQKEASAGSAPTDPLEQKEGPPRFTSVPSLMIAPQAKTANRRRTYRRRMQRSGVWRLASAVCAIDDVLAADCGESMSPNPNLILPTIL